MRTARAKGLSPQIVDSRHVLRNAMLPIATIIGLQVGLLLSGAVLTETVFQYPGVGTGSRRRSSTATTRCIQGGILFLAIIFVIVNLVVDVSYALPQPTDPVQLDERSPKSSQPSSRSSAPTGGLWRDAWFRLRRNPSAIVGAVFVIAVRRVAIFAPLIAPVSARDRSRPARRRPAARSLRRALVRHERRRPGRRSRASSTARGSRSSSASSR